MSWKLFEEKHQIAIREPFIEKYKLTVIADIMAGSMSIKTKAEIRWEVKVKTVNDDGVDIEIITLDNQLIETNNPMAKEMALMSQAFSKMYSEINITLNDKYKIVHINNLDIIHKKWDWLKVELENIKNNNEAVQNVIEINDQLFATPEKIKTAIENNEFFAIFFHHIYGTSIPNTMGTFPQKNLFNTAFIKWNYNTKLITNIYMQPNYVDIEIEGFPNMSFDKNWVKEAYKNFSHLNVAELKPKHTENGHYRIEQKTGKLLQATLERKEVVHPQLLHATILYELISETAENNKIVNKTKHQNSFVQ